MRDLPPAQDLTPNSNPPTVTKGFVAKDDPRFPNLHCTNVQVTRTKQYATWFGGSAEGADDIKVWQVNVTRRRKVQQLMEQDIHSIGRQRRLV